MGFSYQKARFVLATKTPKNVKSGWLEKTWPEIMKQAEQKTAHILFGDEASLPRWGTLTYTWAKRGQQPTVPTSGIRKGYKDFGLIDYFTGRFFYKVEVGCLTSETYSDLLRDVLDRTQEHIILLNDLNDHGRIPDATVKTIFLRILDDNLVESAFLLLVQSWLAASSLVTQAKQPRETSQQELTRPVVDGTTTYVEEPGNCISRLLFVNQQQAPDDLEQLQVVQTFRSLAFL